MQEPATRTVFLGTIAIIGVAAGCSAVLPPSLYPTSTVPPVIGPATGNISFKLAVVPILKQNCASCHGPSGPGSFAMFDAQGEARHDTIRARMPDMISAIKQGRMPLGRPGAVPAEQVAQLEAWLQSSAPNN